MGAQAAIFAVELGKKCKRVAHSAGRLRLPCPYPNAHSYSKPDPGPDPLQTWPCRNPILDPDLTLTLTLTPTLAHSPLHVDWSVSESLLYVP